MRVALRNLNRYPRSTSDFYHVEKPTSTVKRIFRGGRGGNVFHPNMLIFKKDNITLDPKDRDHAISRGFGSLNY